MTKPSTSLAAHIKNLKAKDKATPQKANDALLFWGCAADKSYLPQLKGCVGAATVFIRLEEVSTLTQLKMYCHQKGITRVISSSVSLLHKLVQLEGRKKPSLSNYAGSHFYVSPIKEDGDEIEVVIIPPLKQIVTVSYGKFITKRLITKLTQPSKWFVAPDFTWAMLTPSNVEDYFWEFSREECFLIAVDIETFRENAAIRCISYTGFFYDANEPSGLHSETVVLPLDSTYNLAVMRRFNWELKAPKVLQNGKYDAAYLARYSAPMYNYLYDTANMFHAWLTELPKDLGFLNAFFIREATYWKDLAETNDLHEYYRYNALDTWGTGCALLAMLIEMPDWATNNYLMEFPLVFPCHLSEMTGIERDMTTLAAAKATQDAIIAEHSASLDKILGVKNFNVNSGPQMKALFTIIGCGDFKSRDEKHIKKAMFRHPLNTRILGHVLKVRKARKLVSTYITPGKEFHRLDGTGNRILYALNPHGTDSGRLASREHHFWCGLQVQNIPRGPAVKQTLMADPGFELREVDLAQAESRDTGYISGDETLIHNVEYSPDFHSANASAFFGVPFEEIYDAELKKVIDKALRQLAKPVNHGANYNMGAYVLIDTMGEENIIKAKKLLGLPRFWTMIQVAEYLLESFHKTYPDIKEVFYKGVVNEILTTGKLVSTALHNVSSQEVYAELWEEGHRSWIRQCFGHPDKNKQHLNTYISHPPQSLNAMTLNISYMRVFFEIAMHPEHSQNFKLCAQIHDSILFQNRIGHDYLGKMVADLMEIPVTVRGYDGEIRTFTVPADAAIGGKYWSDIKG